MILKDWAGCVEGMGQGKGMRNPEYLVSLKMKKF